MEGYINQHFNDNKYVGKLNCENINAYINKNGWNDYFIGNNIIFSHRKNQYNTGNFPDYLHSHDFYEIVIYLNGNMQYIADNEFYDVKNGSITITKPHSIHMVRMLSSSYCDRYVIYFKPDTPSFIDNNNMLFDFATRGNANCNYMLAKTQEKDLIISVLNEIECDFEKPHPDTNALVYGYMIKLFCLLNRSDTQTDNSRASLPGKIYEIKQYIDNNYIEIKSINDIAEHFFYSNEYISRLFKQYFNTPLYEYIIKRKITYCKQLFEANTSVENACHLCGFHNMSSFIKQFKKFTGVSPSVYKKRL